MAHADSRNFLCLDQHACTITGMMVAQKEVTGWQPVRTSQDRNIFEIYTSRYFTWYLHSYTGMLVNYISRHVQQTATYYYAFICTADICTAIVINQVLYKFSACKVDLHNIWFNCIGEPSKGLQLQLHKRQEDCCIRNGQRKCYCKDSLQVA